MSEISTENLRTAIRLGAADYFDQCRARVDGFISNHFRYPGAWRTNRPALGWDLLRAPANLFWAPFYLVIMLLSTLGRKIGWTRLSALLRRIPAGFDTRVQRHITDLINKDLLRRNDVDGTENELSRAIAASLESCAGAEGAEVNHRQLADELERLIAEAMQQYRLTRTASADITNSVSSTILGAFAFKKFTPGGIAVGFLLASWVAQEQAIDRFFLGEFLGGLFYRVFPAEPSFQLQLAGVTAVLALLAVFASLSGLITDPIQSWTGLHRYRLNRMIDHLQRDFEELSDNSFHPKDPYVARLLEMLDVVIRF